MKTDRTIYLIDGSAYMHRAYHAIQGLSNSKGLPTQAIFGFTRMLLKLIEDKKPSHVVIIFDAKGPTFRHEIFADYKANRPPMPDDFKIQIPYIKDVVEGFNIPMMELPGYEADDLIGTLTEQAEQAGFSVVIVTGDKDFLQLVSDRTLIYDPMKDKATDLTSFRNEYRLEPRQMTEVMGLSGDTSDNIPGVPGIGPKTALDLIRQFGSMDRLYENLAQITRKKQKENLIQYKDQAFLSKQLVTIDTHAPVSFDDKAFEAKEPDAVRLGALFKTLEFRQLQKQFPEYTDKPEKHYHTVLDDRVLQKLASDLEASGEFALDTETTSEDPMKAELVGLSVSFNANEGWYIPCAHRYIGVPDQLRLDHVLSVLKPVLENPGIHKIGQNIKYDWIVLHRHGIQLSGVMFDTMLASYLINPSKRAHNLDQIALDFLNYSKISYEEVAGKGKKATAFSEVSIETAAAYACEDADITLTSYRKLLPMLKDMGLDALMQEVEMPLVPVLMNMEMQGFRVNPDRLQELSKSFEHQLHQLEQQIYEVAGEPFNINSSQQLGTILFDKLGLPTQKKTKMKTGYSTDVDVLTSLAYQHKLPNLVLRHRTLAKLKSTYTDALLKLIHPETGRIHTSFNQTVTATGRLSSSEPNLQNIPIRDEEGRLIRSAFIPRDGWLLLSADYSQIELRILAHYSDDPILLQAFANNEDVHTRTALEVFQVMPEMLTSDLRRQAKAINFGIVYGMSPYGLSQQLGISQKMAKTYIENYFNRYKGVKRFIDQAILEARKTQQTSTLLGRIRLLPDINSSNRNIRSAAERIAMNTPIQGTAADLIKLAMIRMDHEIRRAALKSVMVLSVHDELVFEVPEDELDILASLVKQVMEGIRDNLRVSLKVNISHGKNWAEAH